MIELTSLLPRSSGVHPLVRGAACAAIAAASTALAPAAGHAHTDAFVFEFTGPGAISATGSDYLITVDHNRGGAPGTAGLTGLDDFVLAYRVLGGSITAIDYAGTDAEARLPIPPPPPDPATHFQVEFSATPPGVATQLFEVAPEDPFDWFLFRDTLSTFHFMTVVPDTDDVRNPVVMEITDQVDSNEISWAQDNQPYPLAIFHRHSVVVVDNFLPPAAKRRVRANNLLPEGELDGDDTGALTTFTNAGFDSVLFSINDVDGSENSGSADTQFSSPVDGDSASLRSLCIPVTGDTDYHTGGALRAGTGQLRPGTIGVDVLWHDDAACGSSIGTSARVTATPGPTFDEVAQTVTSPSTAQSAQVQCTAVVTGTTSNTFFATCDSLYLPEPSTSASTLAALGTLFGLAAFGRRAPRASH